MLLPVFAMMLGGCGGSSSGTSTSTTTTAGTTTTTTTLPATPVTGFWNGTQGTSGTEAILLSNGDAWVVYLESGAATNFARLQLQTAGRTVSGTGTRYLLGTGGTEAVTGLTGTLSETNALSGSMTTAGGSTTFSLAPVAAGSISVAASTDAAGSWSGAYGNGASSLSLTITGSGALTGTSTTGCSYSGSLLPRAADPALFDISFTETCLVGSPKSLSGIAKLNGAKTTVSFAVTTVDRSGGALFTGFRQ